MSPTYRVADEEKVIRVRRISPVDCALFFLFIHEVLYLVFALTVKKHLTETIGTVSSDAWLSGALKVGVAGVVAGILFALLFNIYGSLVGLRLWTTVDARIAPPEAVESVLDPVQPAALFATSQGTSETKPCPTCATKVRADRTFCNACGYDFD